MNVMDTFKDNLSLNLFGRARTLALALESCVSCGKSADRFTDKLSQQEFGISGLCQCCQDKFFSEDMSNEG
jgi:hypothetical protein